MASASGAATPAARSAPVAGLTLGLVWAGASGASALGLPQLGDGAALALGLYLLLRLRHLSLESLCHLLLAGLVIAVTLAQGAQDLAWQGVVRAAQVAALFAGLSMLRFAAIRSTTMQQAGAMMAAQPAGRRYVAMTGGAHLVGLVLNFGVVTLLGPMIGTLRGRGSEALKEGLSLAVLRGFSTTFLWSPLTLSFGIVTSVLIGVDPLRMVAFGAGCALLVLVLGWLFDRWRPREGGMAQPPVTAGLGVPLRVVGVVLSLMALVLALHLGLGVPLITGVVMGAPLYAAGWLALLSGSPGKGVRAVGHAVALEAAIDGRTMAVLGAAALMGTLIGGLVPEAAVRSALTAGWVPPALVPVVFMALVLALGIAGANPLLSVMMVIGILPEPAQYGINPEALGLSLVSAWGLSLGVSRGGAALIALAQSIGSTPGQLGLRGNLPFTLAAMALMAVVVTLMTVVLPPV